MSAVTIDDLLAEFQMYGDNHVLVSDGKGRWAITDDVSSNALPSDPRPLDMYFDAFVAKDEWCDTIPQALIKFMDNRSKN